MAWAPNSPERFQGTCEQCSKEIFDIILGDTALKTKVHHQNKNPKQAFRRDIFIKEIISCYNTCTLHLHTKPSHIRGDSCDDQ